MKTKEECGQSESNYPVHSRFKERTTDKNKNYNSCYIYLDDGGYIKEECAECSLCVVEDIFHELICKSDKLCEYG